MKVSNIAAIILAAGYSSRFGGFKPIVNIDTMTVLDHAVGLFKSIGISNILVVAGHRWPDLVQKLNLKQMPWVLNENYNDGMFSSIRIGVASLHRQTEAFFILPVDIPLVRRQTVLDLIKAYHSGKGDILFPVFNGKRGHPPLISCRYGTAILQWRGEGGLQGLLEQYESSTADVQVVDEFIHLDLDTPEDLEMLRARYRTYDIPSLQECIVLLKEKAAVPKEVLEHSRAVAHTALSIAGALKDRGCHMEFDLIGAAALLHDIAKGRADHARLGAQMLRDMGFHGVAGIVASHMDINLIESAHLYPDEIVYLADKLVHDTRRITLAERFQQTIKRCGASTHARKALTERMDNARKIQHKVESQAGKSMEEILTEYGHGDIDEAADHIPAPAW